MTAGIRGSAVHGTDSKYRSGCRCNPCYQAMRERGRIQMSTEYGERSKRNSQLKKKFKITLFDYESLLEKQDNICAICRQPEDRRSRYGGICRLSVDHDHMTGEVRGLLCHRCNMALGYVRENPGIALNLAKYIKIFLKFDKVV